MPLMSKLACAPGAPCTVNTSSVPGDRRGTGAVAKLSMRSVDAGGGVPLPAVAGMV